MNEGPRELVIVVTKGTAHELSSIAFAMANEGITAGLRVTVLLVSASVDLVRRRAATQPLEELIADFLRRGGTLWARSACVKARGYALRDFIDGVKIAPSGALAERVLADAAVLSF